MKNFASVIFIISISVLYYTQAHRHRTNNNNNSNGGAPSSKYAQNFASYEITPDVISVAPPDLVSVEYPKTHQKANLGNEIHPKDVRDVPEIHYDADEKSLYTLIMTDPDAPSHKNPTMKEWNHWLVVNIPGNEIAKGETIAEYVGAGPPKDTGLHRYAFIVFKQPEMLKVDEPHKSKNNGNRGGFNTIMFAKKYNLGNPIAGNYFEAKFDDSVPELHKQLNSDT